MDPADLKALIDAQPDGSPVRVAYALGDVACAVELNRPGEKAYIPRRHVVVTLTNFGQVDGLLKWVLQFGTLPAPFGGDPADFGFYCLCQRISRIAANDVGVQLLESDLDAAVPMLTPFILAGAIPVDFFDALKAGKVFYGLAEGELGRPVTPADVGATRDA